MGSPGPVPGQLDLFAERACLTRDLERALSAGDFGEAGRLRRLLEQTYGGTPETRALRFLDERVHLLDSTAPEIALSAWRASDAELEPHPFLRRLLHEGLFRRLLGGRGAEDLATACPSCLPAIARALASGLAPSTANGRAAARQLVHDALLEGRVLESLEFPWDEALGKLLAEHDAPCWLACLGTIRRLWPAPRPTTEDVDALSGPFRKPESTEEEARAFWSCLKVANEPDCPEAARHEARRRMKKLRRDFHALYMRQLRP